ncbi:hypothetical protein C5167_050083 [Papaver somniferum]|uniref:Uncharacterized protein n=1 Tax=Papaver somniferum TaxID=3469 RepID=A0A4Y7KMM9_PAPSO|nr:hypothetical protein C5167_050083 [Papaver somniferum]
MDATKKSMQKESWCTARSMLWMVYNMRCAVVVLLRIVGPEMQLCTSLKKMFQLGLELKIVDMRTYRPQSDLRGAAIHRSLTNVQVTKRPNWKELRCWQGVSVECDLSMKASKVVGMTFLKEEGNIVDLEVEVQCIEEVDRVRIMEWKTVKFMTDKGPSSNKD